MTGASKSPNAGVLAAIDAEHRDLVHGANAIFHARMKPARAAMQAARVAFDAAQRKFKADVAKHAAERDANLVEANARRAELRQAVSGARPVIMADFGTIRRVSAKGVGVSLARVTIIDAEARA